MNWAPIAMAPKDITIMGFYGGIARPVRWSLWGCGVWECAATGHRLSGEPSHWDYMPNPPKQ